MVRIVKDYDVLISSKNQEISFCLDSNQTTKMLYDLLLKAKKVHRLGVNRKSINVSINKYKFRLEGLPQKAFESIQQGYKILINFTNTQNERISFQIK